METVLDKLSLITDIRDAFAGICYKTTPLMCCSAWWDRLVQTAPYSIISANIVKYLGVFTIQHLCYIFKQHQSCAIQIKGITVNPYLSRWLLSGAPLRQVKPAK